MRETTVKAVFSDYAISASQVDSRCSLELTRFGHEAIHFSRNPKIISRTPAVTLHSPPLKRNLSTEPNMNSPPRNVMKTWQPDVMWSMNRAWPTLLIITPPIIHQVLMFAAKGHLGNVSLSRTASRGSREQCLSHLRGSCDYCEPITLALD